MKARLSFSLLPSTSVDLLVVAGEASGDEHAAALIRGLKKQNPGLKVAALGGPRAKEAGADLLFNLVDHAVVGIYEVFKNYSFFKGLFDLTCRWIDQHKPKTILLVDYPGFNLRLAEALQKKGLSQKGGGHIKVLQYVSPQLWAWKPKRRFTMEKVLDGLGVIFPFEVECYKDVKLPVSFVGHPFMNDPLSNHLIKYEEEGPLLLLPGSRVQAVERILPVLLDTFAILQGSFPDLIACIPAANPKISCVIQKIIKSKKKYSKSISVTEDNHNLCARLALMSSGTMSLRCALSGIPGAIVYKTHPLTFLIGKLFVKVPHLGMANLLLPHSPPYPEFIQGMARADLIAQGVYPFFSDLSKSRATFKHSANYLRENLCVPQANGVVDWLMDTGGLR
ncbi:MAG: lipid-A-disaccharide synthase [Opitutales bacterium]|nr:lipid-A-disaccharide synthase [Opitutales bacterium]